MEQVQFIFDTHGHYQDRAFDEDREQVLRQVRAAGVAIVTEIGDTIPNSIRAVELARRYRTFGDDLPFMCAAVGVHPDNVGELNDSAMEDLRRLAMAPEVVAIGEIGLDYHWNVEQADVQQYWFRRQVELASELKLPVNIHSRDAAEDTLNLARELKLGEVGGIVHCYSYSVEHAREYVKMGLYLGIGGVVTYKNGRKLKAVVREIPLEHLVLETDCPYLAPTPHRGERNSSAWLPYVAETIAELKGITAEEVIRVTCENARRVYRLPAGCTD